MCVTTCHKNWHVHCMLHKLRIIFEYYNVQNIVLHYVYCTLKYEYSLIKPKKKKSNASMLSALAQNIFLLLTPN